ncbi:hypothetical protein AOC36_05595 [Erysipelothrix larvae]|uniref:dITP/XTP pyrophosphatase n=1 Tax=Erysipelothrix larvae TaxID=1514105 RepID=A0A0X8GZX9_9FIRM|nr:RdgB/HAM1 family non-canonical purine NTP pyrophosphatase [Erysipelothrix larvae]AMC93470.1 hypothetical protein AOC36_05595 [Erysipelothrix larvae]
MKIVVASHNKGKIKEFNEILGHYGYEVLGVDYVGIDLEHFEETGTTFEENAYLKAKYVFDLCHIPTIADDSGLVLNAFPDILGVYSARFMGEDTPYDIKNNRILELYQTQSDRSSMFVSAISYVTDETHKIFIGEVKGQIAHSIVGDGGFGYDPIFIPNGFECTYAQLDSDIKNQISHRGIALRKFVEYIKEQTPNEK